MNGQPMGGGAPPQAPPTAPPQTPMPPPGGGGSRTPWILAIVAIAIAVVLGAVLIVTLVLSPSERSASSGESNGTKEAEATGTVEPATSGDYEVSSGPITSPGGGDAVRSALMDAARETLGTEAQFYVLQLAVQGDAALAELQPVGSPDISVVAYRDDGGWKGVWTGPATYAGASELGEAGFAFSQDLIDALDWTPAPTSTEAATAMVDMLTRGTAFDPADFEGDALSLVKGTDGGWWARGWVYPVGDPTLESEQFFITRPKGSSEWEAVEVGTGVEVSDLEGKAPPNVIEQFNACDT